MTDLGTVLAFNGPNGGFQERQNCCPQCIRLSERNSLPHCRAVCIRFCRFCWRYPPTGDFKDQWVGHSEFESCLRKDSKPPVCILDLAVSSCLVHFICALQCPGMLWSESNRTTCFTHQCLPTVLATRKLCEEIADECSRTLRQVYLWKRVRKFGSTWLFDSLESNFSHLPSLGSPKHVAGIWWTQVDFSWPPSKSGQIWRRPPKWPEQREQTKK